MFQCSQLNWQHSAAELSAEWMTCLCDKDMARTDGGCELVHAPDASQQDLMPLQDHQTALLRSTQGCEKNNCSMLYVQNDATLLNP